MLGKIITSSAMLVLCFGPTSAFGDGSVFDLVEPTGTLEVGGEVRGALSASDLRLSSDSFAEVWALEGQVGEQVTLDLVSDAFDAFLLVVGPGFERTLHDDDGGGGCHARITFDFLESGTFRVVATSVGERETGTYVLRASETPGPVPRYACGGVDPAVFLDLPTDDRRIAPGGEVRGVLARSGARLDDGTPVQAWSVEGRAGESVLLSVESDVFDTFLSVVGPGLADVLSDDDSAGDYDAMLEITFPEDGTYRAVVSAVGGGSGPYTIRAHWPVTLEELETAGRVLRPGEETVGRFLGSTPMLEGGGRAEAWTLRGRAGETHSIELRSGAFDAYLCLIGPGLSEPLTDDDSAGELNALLEVTFPEDGMYTVVASSIESGAVGEYTLTLDP